MSETTELPASLLDEVREIIGDELRTGYRAGAPIADQNAALGLLADFQGSWRGAGFNLVARPFFKNEPPFFLELNATRESLDFTAISGQVPNRGSLQPDQFLSGVRYLQQVTDADTDTGIHIEPGLWMHVPASDDPKLGESYVRQSTIPHGDSLVAQSTLFTTVPGGPLIRPVDTIPFTDDAIPPLNAAPLKPITNPAYLAQYLKDDLPARLPPGLVAAEAIRDPTLVLKAQIRGQKIVKTDVIEITTAQPGGFLGNIPFVTANANATRLDAIFWVETVELPSGRRFVQLQYVQRVILDFIGIHWPHVSVATLKRV